MADIVSWQILQPPQDLGGCIAKIYVHALGADDALAVHDHITHFGKAASHVAHGPACPQLHIKLLCDTQIGIGQQGKPCADSLCDLLGVATGIRVDADHCGLQVVKLVNPLLQLTELLYAKVSDIAHVEREHVFTSIARLEFVGLTIRVR